MLQQSHFECRDRTVTRSVFSVPHADLPVAPLPRFQLLAVIDDVDRLVRGDLAAVPEVAPVRLQGSLAAGGQELVSGLPLPPRGRLDHPDYYARLWLLGQAVTSHAAVDLLVSRAEGSLVPPEKTGKPWPEFAEYACYACHKNLSVLDPQQDLPRQLALAATFLLFVAVLTVVGMLVSDLLLAALDPRIRFGATSEK